VVPDPALLEGLTIDLAALENGADVAARSDQNSYSAPRKSSPPACPG
jgi:allantoicase